tara:strand:- start:1172 stop:1402 length:231 start_codon:yes stop_codon:yes gene_type:complete
MSLFSKIFNLFKSSKKAKFKKIINESMNKNERNFERLGDDMDYDGIGNHGRFPPIIGDDYPTYEQIIKEYESQNSK